MAPTICMTDIPKAGTDAPCVRRKYWQERAINRHSRFELKEISVKNGNWEANCQELSLPEARIPEEPKYVQWRILERRRKELLDIVIRTLVLVRRNHRLQKRMDALCLETQQFVRSQLRNRQLESEVGEISKQSSIQSSSIDTMEVDNTRQSNNNEPEIKSPNPVTSACILSNTDSGVSSDCSF
ncbi:uncharacterized protein LOC135170554 [Diachasmimorpha longicaudata]|uniref:uncharacterized protein LOC135170554 n=1 Tax=Diachasmimorpha longicaudata TaxID=58733 RepID=UPI0030B8B20F